jgi:2-amino-4-hydroxy-6-hydroxymethyldihydropteridine diphosphokinase
MMSSGSRIDTAVVEAYLGLGTNLGDRAANLHAAIRGIARVGRIDGISDVYESAPWGHADQPDFWNLALRVHTALSARELMLELQSLEKEVGRTPTFRMGPRIIDIDILLYGQDVIDDAELRVPHHGILERQFVLMPLLDLEPAMQVNGILLSTLVTACGIRRIGTAAEVLGEIA